MARKTETQVNIAVLEERYNNLKEFIQEGFEGVFKRQDIANGKLMKHEAALVQVTTKMENVMTKEKCAQVHANLVKEDKKEVSGDYSKLKYVLIGIAASLTSGIIGAIAIKFLLN